MTNTNIGKLMASSHRSVGAHLNPKTACLFALTLLLSSAILLWPPAGLHAQAALASINGTVKDSSGAVLPGATVVLRNTATGVKQTAQTNDVGIYVILNIAPGNYTLEAGRTAFVTRMLTGITLSVNQSTTFDFTLSVGSTRQSVTVTTRATMLQTSTADLGVVVNEQEVNNLPLNGRNFSQLLTLTPGASPANVSQNAGGGNILPTGVFSAPAVNGQINRSNLYLLDGINDLEPQGNTYAVPPVLDDIQEFKVQSHSDQAAFGGVLGGTVNVVTKSGTNQFHGDAWEFWRNNALSARNFFLPNTTVLNQNQFGGTFGGPVLLPHYNGHDRTFFFVDYEGFRQATGEQGYYNVPTPAMLNGDFSAVTKQIYNPYSTTPDPLQPGSYIRTPFPNNQIPTSLFDPSAVKWAKNLWPAAINTGNPNFNGLDTASNYQTADSVGGRIDEQITDKSSAWFRYDRYNGHWFGNGGIVGLTSSVLAPGYNLGASYTHSFGSSTVLQATFGRNAIDRNSSTTFTNAPSSFANQLGLSQRWTCLLPGASCLLPTATVAGYVGAGEGKNNATLGQVYEWKLNLAHTHGKHTTQAGVDINTANTNVLNANPGVAFSAFQSSNPLSPGNTGDAMASFLLGVPASASLRNFTQVETGGMVNGFYVQDQWKATDRLTVNGGLRYDFTLIPALAINGKFQSGDMDFNTGQYILQQNWPSCAATNAAPCIPGGSLPANVVVSPLSPRIYHNVFDNVQPRLGLAYRVNGSTVVRASFGRFFDNWSGITQTAGNFGGTWPGVQQFLAQNLNVTGVTRTFEDPLGLGAGATFLPGPTPFNQVQWYMNPYFQNPYSYQWNFGVQHQLGMNTLLSVNYVGSSDSRLDVGDLANTAVTPGPGNPASRAPYSYVSPSYYDQSIGRANYNALQVSLNKKFGNGLTYLVSYTWSKSEDLGCSGLYGVEGCSIENAYNLDANKSVSAFSLTNMFNAAWVYELPFGAGKRFSSGSSLVNSIFGNWQVNGILTLASGPPYFVSVSGDIANIGNSGYERANLVGNPYLANPTPSEWLNKAAFQAPAVYTFGNLGRNALRQDATQNLDVALFREFPITESKRLELRLEVFNSTNNPIFSPPDSNLSDPRFGVVSAAGPPREIQIAVKLYF